MLETAGTGQDWQRLGVLVAQKGPLFYWPHGIGIFAALAAGLLALLKGKIFHLKGYAAAAGLTLSLAAVIWAIFTYSQSELFSMQVFGATGPFIWLTMIMLFAGMEADTWALVNPLIAIVTYVTCALAILDMVTDPVIYAGYSKHVAHASTLVFVGGWTVLTSSRRGSKQALPLAIIVVTLLCGIFARGRSWILLALLVGVIWFIRRGTSRRDIAMRFLASGILVPLLLVVLIVTATAVRPDIGEKFNSHLTEDTRTSQYVLFFEAVPWQDLLLGRGPEGAWYWSGGDFQFFDNGYLWMLFIGGLPILISYCILILIPAVRVVLSHAPPPAAVAAASLLILWGLTLAGLGTFAGPSLTTVHFFICLLAGRCHEWLYQKHITTNHNTTTYGSRSSIPLILHEVFPR